MNNNKSTIIFIIVVLAIIGGIFFYLNMDRNNVESGVKFTFFDSDGNLIKELHTSLYNSILQEQATLPSIETSFGQSITIPLNAVSMDVEITVKNNGPPLTVTYNGISLTES
jgi:hypothetical protein